MSLSTSGFPQGKGGGGGGGGTTPPPNPEIVFVDWGNGAIGVMNADGTNARSVLTAGRGIAYYWPSWDPGGQSISFFGVRSGTSGIWRVNLDGSGLHLVTASTAYTRLDWARVPSPDGGRRMVFCDYLPGTSTQNLFVMNGDGSQRTNLNSDPSQYVGHGFWLGGRVAYLRSVTSAIRAITLGFNLDGSAYPISEEIVYTIPTNITTTSLRESNSSQLVLFHGGSSSGLNILDLAGGSPEVRLLTSPPIGALDRWGGFSPNDSQVVFDRLQSSSYSIYTVNADGSGLMLLRKKAAMPSWKLPAY